ncbi:hypothetical protein LWI29_004220 [Acer saccharum]|uniref:Uncharacterized protein n=1 Tax=Acer saccharum TaxID=4024 RepID=A0AA39VID1_ACESA|nr:hypothetical protein LWI29_004220 [Acer saccharum]
MASLPHLHYTFFSESSLKHHCVTTIRIPESHISCLAAHNNLLYAASINEINVYELSNFTHIDTFNNDHSDSGSVKSIAFDSTKIFTAHQDCKIRVWQITTPSKQHKLVSTLPTVKDRLLHFLLPKNYISVRRHQKRLWVEHCDTVSDLTVKDGFVYSVSWDKSIKIWNAKSYKCLESVCKAHEDAVNAVAVSENGVIYTGSSDGRIRVWERSINEERTRRHILVGTLEKHKSAVNALALKGDGSFLFSGGSDRSIVVWEREVNANHVGFLEALWGHTGAVLCLINVDDDDLTLVSGSADRTVRIWQRGKETGYRCMIILQGHEKPVKSLVAVQRGDCNGVVSVCSGSLDGEIKVWDMCGLEKKSISN